MRPARHPASPVRAGWVGSESSGCLKPRVRRRYVQYGLAGRAAPATPSHSRDLLTNFPIATLVPTTGSDVAQQALAAGPLDRAQQGLARRGVAQAELALGP